MQHIEIELSNYWLVTNACIADKDLVILIPNRRVISAFVCLYNFQLALLWIGEERKDESCEEIVDDVKSLFEISALSYVEINLT